MVERKSKINIKALLAKWLNRFSNLFLLGILAFFILSFIQIFCLTSFKIPSDSMKPTLIPGDKILVDKLAFGARLFNVSAMLDGKDAPIYRVPGLGSIKRNDVLVFNFPYPKKWSRIDFDVMLYYVKRCVGLPGDSIAIDNGFYRINGLDMNLGNEEMQNTLSKIERETLPKGVLTAFPQDSVQFNWTIYDFGPLYIPKKGDVILLNKKNYRLYKRLIEFEQKKDFTIKNEQYCLNDSIVKEYRFLSNYYFMAGDNLLNSQDSRYWGLLPEEYIVGKALFIWKSKDLMNDEVRWERIFKRIK